MTKTLSREEQWDLATHFLKRSDQSADFFRTILFAASSGAIWVATSELWVTQKEYHVAAVISFVVSFLLLVISWDVQKRKADCRFKWLRDGETDRYHEHSERVQKNWYLKNYIYDRTAVGAIVIGFLFELAARICA